jgi:hypothetical protein
MTLLGKAIEVMLESFFVTSKILCYVKDEGTILGSMVVALLKLMISCETLSLSTPNGEYFEHAMSKVAQYAINNDKVSKDSMPIIVKFTQASLQHYMVEEIKYVNIPGFCNASVWKL